VPVGGHPGGDHHRLGDHPPIDPGLAAGGVEEDVGERLLGEAAVPERADFGVEVGADPGDLGSADAGVGAQRPHQVIDLPGGDAVQTGLHDHREQRLVDPSPAFQQRREDRAGAQLGDPQLQIPRGRGQDAGPGAVALRGPGVGALVRRGADHRGPLGLDQRLMQRLGGGADAVIGVGNFQCLEQLEADWSRTIAWPYSSECSLAGTRRTSTRWPLARRHFADALKTSDQLHHVLGRHLTLRP
jgi:hypothetical protein